MIRRTLILVNLLYLPLVLSSDVPWLEQVSRQETLQSGCEKYYRSNMYNVDYNNLYHIIVDHQHKLLYCYVPKVACTNWKRMFLVLTGKINTTDVVGINSNVAHNETLFTKLSDMSKDEIDFALRNYTSFLIVRHPFERLLSAYRNKFENSQPSGRYFQEKFGRKIIKNHRKNPTPDDLKTGANVTFKEFVLYLIAEGVNNENANEHWRSIDSLCQPCFVNYTFIGKYETFSDDADIILGMANAPKLTFPQTHSERTGERLRMYFQMLQLEYIEELYRLYERDFKLFGYTSNNVLGFDIG